MFGKIKKLHFVGIGGAGMSGIAEILTGLSPAAVGKKLVGRGKKAKVMPC